MKIKNQQTKKKVAVVITYYSGLKKIKNTIKSVIKNMPGNSEIIVVDNSENERLKKELIDSENVKYVKNYKNTGYGAGNNLGAANTLADYLFFLNPDTLIDKKTIPKLTEFLENHKKVGVAAPNLLDPAGKIYPQLGSGPLNPISGIFALSFINSIWPKNPVSQKYWQFTQDTSKNREVAVVPGSAFMIRRDLFNSVGCFDEKFFLFFEESDICKRVREKGYKIYFVAESQVVHIWKFDAGREDKPLRKHFNKSRFYYFTKHYGIFWALIVEAFARFSKVIALFFSS